MRRELHPYARRAEGCGLRGTAYGLEIHVQNLALIFKYDILFLYN